MRRETVDNVLMAVLGIVFLLNMLILSGILSTVNPTIGWLLAVGWVALIVGAALVVLSIVSLKRKGRENLIDVGVYGVVRHPMYAGGMLLFVSHIFFGQDWLIALSTVVGLCCCYLLTLSEDRRLIERFGQDYRRYMSRVPRINLASGMTRAFGRKSDRTADR